MKAQYFTDADFQELQHLLPPSFLSLIAVAGTEAAFALVRQLGGTHFPVGKNQTAAGKRLFASLAEIVGEPIADKISRAYETERKIWIPKCQDAVLEMRNRLIRRQFDELTANGHMSAQLAVRNLALAHNLTERWVWEITVQTDKTPEASQQQQLF